MNFIAFPHIFTKKGDVTLKVSSEGNLLVFEIKDTGMGIKEEDIPNLFNIFEQTDTRKNRSIVGTGLGLPICKSFIEMMGGSIFIKSNYGVGTSVIFNFPVVRGQAEKVQESDTASIVFIAPDAFILIVDDNEFNLKVADGFIKRLKIKTQLAYSGAEAIDFIQKNEFDIVFMDHMMPGMDGVEATERIRKLGNNIPIVALTANSIKGAEEMFLANGFNDFISKPIDSTKLYSIIKKWLPENKIIPYNETLDISLDDGYDLPKELQAIAELNLDIGLKHFMNNKETYYNTMELFCKRLPSDIENLNEMLKSIEIPSFGISVHSLKSVLATLGFSKLAEYAFKLEKYASSGELELIIEQFPDFNKTILNLHERLSPIFYKKENMIDKSPGDIEYLIEKLTLCKEASSNFDNETGLEIATYLLTYDFGEQVNEQLRNLLLAFTDFDFDTADSILDNLI